MPDPAVSTSAAGSAGSVSLAYLPAGAIPTTGANAVCNGYVPNNTTLARFLWTVGVLARNGFIVVLDQHLNTDTTLMEDQALWLQARIRCLCTFFVLMHDACCRGATVPAFVQHLVKHLHCCMFKRWTLWSDIPIADAAAEVAEDRD